ncbi:MAG: hypothetical protein GY714_18145 [Desulfobacterales bacterium]|nr:hypothetical protein [Desulfobacterales bacterium]
MDKKTKTSMRRCVAACFGIYEEFDKMEIQEQLTPIREAWRAGKNAYFLVAETDKCIHGG